MHQDILKQEWKNVKQDSRQYFYSFIVPPKTSAGWATIKSSPYRELFSTKFTHMEQAGITARLQRQYSVLKPMEDEVLEPLKLEHFYITLIGIAGGTFLALLTFVVERIRKPKQILLSKKKLFNQLQINMN